MVLEVEVCVCCLSDEDGCDCLVEVCVVYVDCGFDGEYEIGDFFVDIKMFFDMFYCDGKGCCVWIGWECE